MQSSPTKKLKILLAAFWVTNLVTAIFLGRALSDNWWQGQLWEMEMYGRAGQAGSLQAAVDFRAKRKRLYEIYMVSASDEQDYKSKFTGRVDGPFQIYTLPCYQI